MSLRVSLLSAAAIAVATSSLAEERFLRIEVDGELTPETRTAIESAFAEAEIKQARTEAAGQETNLERLCAMKGCSTVLNNTLATHIQRGTETGIRKDPSGRVSITGLTIDGESFLAVPTRPSAGLPVGGVPETVLIPYHLARDSAADPNVIAQELQPAVSPTLDVIAEDLKSVGQSSRQIAIPSGFDDEDLNNILASVEATETPVSFSLETTPANQFQISLAEPVTFETDGTATACTSDENWPYNANEVSDVIEFNFKVLERLGIKRLKRSGVLIMDTGLGAGLAANPDFQPFLDISVSESLYADTYSKDLSLNRVCLDVDGLGLSSDVYGFAIEQTGPAPTGIIPVSCKTHTPLDRILALQANDTASLPPYVPEHGSFVAGLALGGPSLIAASDRIDDLIGLTFARITDTPNSETQTVKTEISTLMSALDFASRRGVDVLNASIRVGDPNSQSVLRNVLSAFDGVIVAAAGNFPEPLTSTSGSFPAGVTQTSFDDRLIVVAALKNDGANSIWENSAHHPQNVDIAAPGANIVSWNLDGEKTCMSGTSAAAPLVSFVAGSLIAFGVRSPSIDGKRSREEVLHRIYATAEFAAGLTGKVKDGRVLDVATSLDVFVDHIWTDDDPTTPRRVLVQRSDGDISKPVFVRACNKDSPGELAGSAGALDAGVMVMWAKGDSGEHADVWHRSLGSLSVENGEMTGCKVADRDQDRLHFLDLSDGQVKSLQLTEVRRIAFSPFRKAIGAAREVALGN